MIPLRLVNSGISSKSLTTIADKLPRFMKLNILDEKKKKTIVIVAIDATPPTSVWWVDCPFIFKCTGYPYISTFCKTNVFYVFYTFSDH